MSVTFRPVRPDDEPFLYKLYCGTRSEDLAGIELNSPQQEVLLKMQFLAQQHSYKAQYPKADHDIILLDGRPIGRVMVERGPAENRGVDIALLPEYRSSGIGGAIIQDLLDEAGRAGKPFRIQVVKSNRAKRLYDRLGFSEVADTGTHYVMERIPGG
ncbi:MAG TPA: GNAT family N-acetyltransferase [Blastocatellia bacterium]|nr:GNAT family N-acetyltransferase [Blastocatellia bacterium]